MGHQELGVAFKAQDGAVDGVGAKAVEEEWVGGLRMRGGDGAVFCVCVRSLNAYSLGNGSGELRSKLMRPVGVLPSLLNMFKPSPLLLKVGHELLPDWSWPCCSRK